jgi:hypothetical protein
MTLMLINRTAANMEVIFSRDVRYLRTIKVLPEIPIRYALILQAQKLEIISPLDFYCLLYNIR